MKTSTLYSAWAVGLVGLTSHVVAEEGKTPLVYPDCVNGLLKTNKVCDKTATPSERAAALVSAMTADEKLVNIIRYVIKRQSIM